MKIKHRKRKKRPHPPPPPPPPPPPGAHLQKKEKKKNTRVRTDRQRQREPIVSTLSHLVLQLAFLHGLVINKLITPNEVNGAESKGHYPPVVQTISVAGP